MFLVAKHRISDPERFWGAGRTAMAGPQPEGVRLHGTYPNKDGTEAACRWEADALDTVRAAGRLVGALAGRHRNLARTRWQPGAGERPVRLGRRRRAPRAGEPRHRRASGGVMAPPDHAILDATLTAADWPLVQRLWRLGLANDHLYALLRLRRAVRRRGHLALDGLADDPRVGVARWLVAHGRLSEGA